MGARHDGLCDPLATVIGRRTTVKEDYPGFGGHTVSMRLGLQGWLG